MRWLADFYLICGLINNKFIKFSTNGSQRRETNNVSIPFELSHESHK